MTQGQDAKPAAVVSGPLLLIALSNSIYLVWNTYYFKLNGDCSIELFILLKDGSVGLTLSVEKLKDQPT